MRGEHSEDQPVGATSRMVHALVLGATGHIGAHIVRALLVDGHQVRAGFRRERFLSVLEDLPVERVHVDLDTLEGLGEALDGCEWVFHAAGYYPSLRTPRAQAIAQAIQSTRRVLEMFEKARPQRVVFTSSAATIRHIPGRAASETDPEPWPLRGWRPLYATVKIAMEHEVLRARQAGLPVVIVNPTVCIGEYDAHPFSGLLVLAFAKYRVPCYLDQHLNTVYTGDVGIGHVRAAERGRLGERYLLTQHHVAIKEFAQRIASEAGVSAPRWRIPHGLAHAMACGAELLAWLRRSEPLLTREIIHSAQNGGKLLDGRKAVIELGLSQTPLEEAIRKAVRWFRAHKYL